MEHLDRPIRVAEIDWALPPKISKAFPTLIVRNGKDLEKLFWLIDGDSIFSFPRQPFQSALEWAKHAPQECRREFTLQKAHTPYQALVKRAVLKQCDLAEKALVKD